MNAPVSFQPEAAPAKDEKLPRLAPDLNRSAVKRMALIISRRTRNGKFTRVSTDFQKSVEAILDAKLRSLRAEVSNAMSVQIFSTKDGEETGEPLSLLTTAGKKKVVDAFNLWIAREMHRQVNKVRVGKTL